MNKIIGYGAPLLVIAGACGLIFGASQAEAGYSYPGAAASPSPTGTPPVDEECNENLEGLCDCVRDVLKDIKHADRNGAGKVKDADKVLEKVNNELKLCVKAFCEDVGGDESCD